jgi:hypothetical protein
VDMAVLGGSSGHTDNLGQMSILSNCPVKGLSSGHAGRTSDIPYRGMSVSGVRETQTGSSSHRPGISMPPLRTEAVWKMTANCW